MARNNDTNDGMYHPNSIDRSLMAGESFDWITPIWNGLGVLFRRTERFSVPIEWMGFVGDQLWYADIKIKGDCIAGDIYIFDIRKRDAAEAAELLGLVRK